MTRDELRDRIRIAAVKFTEEVSVIFGEAFASVAAEFKAGGVVAPPPPKVVEAPPVKRPVGRPPKTDKPDKPVAEARRRGRPPGSGKVAKAVAEDKRNRRSANEIERMGDNIVELLTSTKAAMRAEEINRRLGTNTKELMRPILKLLSTNKIKKDGARRATVYFV